MMPAGSMHSKLQLLKFPNYLRLVIPTGNLVPYDVSMSFLSICWLIKLLRIDINAVKSPTPDPRI